MYQKLSAIRLIYDIAYKKFFWKNSVTRMVAPNKNKFNNLYLPIFPKWLKSPFFFGEGVWGGAGAFLRSGYSDDGFSLAIGNVVGRLLGAIGSPTFLVFMTNELSLGFAMSDCLASELYAKFVILAEAPTGVLEMTPVLLIGPKTRRPGWIDCEG